MLRHVLAASAASVTVLSGASQALAQSGASTTAPQGGSPSSALSTGTGDRTPANPGAAPDTSVARPPVQDAAPRSSGQLQEVIVTAYIFNFTAKK